MDIMEQRTTNKAEHYSCQNKNHLKQEIYYIHFKMVFIFRVFIA